MRTQVFAAAALVLLTGALAGAQYRANFENPPYVTVPGGQITTGQDGWYDPDPATSVDHMIFAYNDPARFIQVVNPYGSAQLDIGKADNAAAKFARAQHDITWPTGKFTIWFDIAATYDYSGVAHDNYASFGARDEFGANVANAAFITLFSGYGYLWGTEDPNLMQCRYLGYNDQNVADAQPGLSPGPAWEPLQLDTWYRTRTTMDFATNKFLTVSIINLMNGAGSSVDLTQDPNYATQWFMDGGAAGHTNWQNFRLFAGGTVGNNVSGWDNVCIAPGIGTGDLNCDGVVSFDDINPFVMALSNPAGYQAAFPNCCIQNGDINLDGAVAFSDINPFVALLSH